MKKRNIDTKPYIGKLMEKISGSKIDHELLQDVIDT
jgi:hypothetical protein